MPPKDKYTDPKLREEVKQDIQAGDKGGQPGQWSARKAQMMASEYKKRGGDYNTDKSEQDASQKNLSKWGEEDWQTKEGSGSAKMADGTEKRYLPKKAWENMSEEEKQATEDKKQEGSKQGQQHVGNTKSAKNARKNANEEEGEKYDQKKEQEKKGKKSGGKQQQKKQDDAEEGEEDDEEDKLGQTNEEGDGEDNYVEEEVEEDAKAGQKRTRSQTKNDSSNNKSRKTDTKSNGSNNEKSKDTYGSKHQSKEAPHPQGSKDRLPKKGQQVTWKAMPGWVEGSVIEVVTSNEEVDGKSIKASKKDPRIALRSSGPSGKIAVHKPDAVYFEDE